MNPHTLEDRILTALLLGSATSAELARMLSADRFVVTRAVGILERHRMVHISGSTSSRWPSKKYPARVHELTKAGRIYAEDMIK